MLCVRRGVVELFSGAFEQTCAMGEVDKEPFLL
jgi:hypothetical protein